MRRRLRTLVLAAVLLAAAAPAAEAKPKPSTFAGTCELSGTVRFTPGLGASAQMTESVADAAGPCTGTWRTGKKTWTLDGDHVTYHAVASGSQSCASGQATGQGYLRTAGAGSRSR